MFDLEQSITNWREQMFAAGIEAAALEELESHLREEIEQAMRSGMGAQQAFELSVDLIGKAARINDEFKKIGMDARSPMRIVTLLMALCGTVKGGAMILPALGRWHVRGVLPLGPRLVGCALVVIAAGAAVCGIRTHRGTHGRKWISIFTVAAGCFYLVPLIQAFCIGKSDLAGWLFCIILAVVSVLFYGGCLYRLWSPGSPISGR